MRNVLVFLALGVVAAQPPTEKALAVFDVLRAANHFPKTTRATETTPSLSKQDRDLGATSSAIIPSALPAGITVKIYKSPKHRNDARLRMVKDCTGCNAITECGAILVYEPYGKANDMNAIIRNRHKEYYATLSKHYHCE